MDLGASRDLSRVDINWYNGASRSYKYKIEVSGDDINYATVVDQTGRTAMGDTSDSFSATARYVRITVTGSSAGWASILRGQGIRELGTCIDFVNCVIVLF